MAIMRATRRVVTQDISAQHLRGLRTAVTSLRHFAEVEVSPVGRAALLNAAATITELHHL